MKRVTRRAVFLLLLLPLGCKVATIRPIESEEGAASGPASFDAARYVDGLWAKDVPQALAGAADLSQLLPALARDADATAARWGRREGSGPYHVIVHGEGRVTRVDTASRAGIATLAVDVPAGTQTVLLQIGPVLRGTAIRDGLPTVSFDQFVNQIQYAEVANELNARVEREVLATLDRQALVGRQVRVAGMARLGGDDEVLTVTPVRLEVVGEP